jgi:hypothetical protein
MSPPINNLIGTFHEAASGKAELGLSPTTPGWMALTRCGAISIASDHARDDQLDSHYPSRGFDVEPTLLRASRPGDHSLAAGRGSGSRLIRVIPDWRARRESPRVRSEN